MKEITTLLAVFTIFSLSAQVGIGTATPNASALLDVYATNAGFLMPRLTTAQRAAIAAPAAGLQVYDTTTNTAWFYNGTAWINMAAAITASNGLTATAGNVVLGGSLTGNTTIAQPAHTLSFTGTGKVSIGTPAPFALDKFSVYTNAGTSDYAVNGYSYLNGGGVYGTNSGTGIGVYGVASGSAIGVYGDSSGPNFAVVADNTGTGAGLYASSLANFGSYTISGTAAYPTAFAANDATAGTAVVGLGNGLASYGYLAQGSGGAFTGQRYGLFAKANLSGSGGTDRAVLAGEFYANATPASVYVGARIGGTNYKILGTGAASVSTTMPTRNGERILFAPEAPENWFFDLGEAELVNGSATVTMDPLFMDCISDAKPFKVFVQGAEGTYGSIRITRNLQDKTFILEDTGGASNGTVQYIIYGIWKQKENLRFPEFKAPFKTDAKEITKDMVSAIRKKR